MQARSRAAFKAFLIGCAIGLAPLPFCIALAGAGHGTYFWFVLFYGPVSFVAQYLGIAGVLLLLFVYGVYSLVLSISRSVSKGLGIIAAFTSAHAFSAYVMLARGDREYFYKMLHAAPIASLLAFLALLGILWVALVFVVVGKRRASE